jgi:CHAT domain-containing protein
MLFPPLPGTAEEAKTISTILAGAGSFLGAPATETALEAVHSPEILHIATHGFFLAPHTETRRRSRGLELEVEPSSGGAEVFDNPLVRSGLALSGANRYSDGEDDGILTALEASSLNLWGTRLVVMSACETGLGRVSRGDGVYGLRRAMVIAGAESLVMSLWKVSDEDTRDLMIGYYKRLRMGGGRTESLRQAQLSMLSKPGTEHPYYWAAFIASGDPRTLAGREVPVGPATPLPENPSSMPAGVQPSARGCTCGAAGRSEWPAGMMVSSMGWLAALVLLRRRKPRLGRDR